MDHVLQKELDRYIHEVYVPRERDKSPGPAAEEKGQDPFSLCGEGLSLSDLVLKVGETFHEMLFRKIAESGMSEAEVRKKIELITEQMQKAAMELEFEQAAKLRDELFRLQGTTIAINLHLIDICKACLSDERLG